jgi:hypothetical protein
MTTTTLKELKEEIENEIKVKEELQANFPKNDKIRYHSQGVIDSLNGVLSTIKELRPDYYGIQGEEDRNYDLVFEAQWEKFIEVYETEDERNDDIDCLKVEKDKFRNLKKISLIKQQEDD